MAKMGKLTDGAMEVIIGLVLLPIISGFIVYAQNDNNTSALTGMTLILPIVGYAVAFGLIGVGIKAMR